ncbi:ribokinase [Cloacibacillus evryensis]|uniref:ribokinase n=1 Tax=Cloacibacillus evryensis TaxID=508460 RepID=UPI003AB4CE69
MKALCFGSINIDYTYRVKHFVKKGETISADSLHIFSGGKGLNQAVALSRAGVETYHAGCIGEDGLFLLKELEEAGVDTRYVHVLKRERTGNAIIQNDLNGDNCIILYGGANRAVTRDMADEVLSGFQRGDCLVLQNEINELPYIIRRAREIGLKIVLNPSPMEASVLELPLECVDCFMLNRVESAQLLGLDDGNAAAETELIEALGGRFPSAEIVLTMGEKGSFYIRGGGRPLRQRAYPAEAVDTTAAGDTFTGFFIGGRMRGLSVPEAMDLAARAAAISVARQGASPSIPTLAEAAVYAP